LAQSGRRHTRRVGAGYACDGGGGSEAKRGDNSERGMGRGHVVRGTQRR